MQELNKPKLEIPVVKERVYSDSDSEVARLKNLTDKYLGRINELEIKVNEQTEDITIKNRLLEEARLREESANPDDLQVVFPALIEAVKAFNNQKLRLTIHHDDKKGIMLRYLSEDGVEEVFSQTVALQKYRAKKTGAGSLQQLDAYVGAIIKEVLEVNVQGPFTYVPVAVARSKYDAATLQFAVSDSKNVETVRDFLFNTVAGNRMITWMDAGRANEQILGKVVDKFRYHNSGSLTERIEDVAQIPLQPVEHALAPRPVHSPDFQ